MRTKFTMLILLLLLLSGSYAIAQSKIITISGKVSSFEESLALEGVRIHVKGTKNYTGTKANGTFSIEVPIQNKVLIFELKEYETQEVIISGKTRYDVILKRHGGDAHSTGNQPYYFGAVNITALDSHLP